MRISLHPKVREEVRATMEHYRRGVGASLANEFYSELRQFILRTAERPGAFAPREYGLRRVNLSRFPYHFLFRVIDGATVRILVVRHHRQRPSFGTRRV